MRFGAHRTARHRSRGRWTVLSPGGSQHRKKHAGTAAGDGPRKRPDAKRKATESMVTKTKKSKAESNGHVNRLPTEERDGRTFVTLEPLYTKTMGEVQARVRGTAPLLYNPWTKKATDAMEAIVTGKPKLGKENRNFDQDLLTCLQEVAMKPPGPKTVAQIPKFEYGVTAIMFKCALVDAGKMFGKHKTDLRRMLFVPGKAVLGAPRIAIEGGAPEMDVRPARVTSGRFDIRVRPIWHEWEAELTIRYQGQFCDGESVIQWLVTSGECCGIGDYRPNGHQSTGDLGTFQVIEASYIPPEVA